MELHIRHHLPMLVVGDTGTGKSFYAQNMLMRQLPVQEFVPAFITFSPHITAKQTQVCAVVINVVVPYLVKTRTYCAFSALLFSHINVLAAHCCKF
jgi:sigma54-dependent transcription regulator